MCKCVQKHSALLKWDLLIEKIQPLVYRKKLILICELGYVRGIMHFIIQSALLDCSFPILVSYIRLVYRTSNFQTTAIVLTSFVKFHKNTCREICFSNVSDLYRELTFLGSIFQQLFFTQYLEHLSMAASDYFYQFCDFHLSFAIIP